MLSGAHMAPASHPVSYRVTCCLPIALPGLGLAWTRSTARRPVSHHEPLDNTPTYDCHSWRHPHCRHGATHPRSSTSGRSTAYSSGRGTSSVARTKSPIRVTTSRSRCSASRSFSFAIERAASAPCQHVPAPGCRLLSGEGNRASIICPYHAWTYGPNGDLIGMRRMEQTAHFDAADYGLIPLRLESWAGFLFVNLDETAQPLRDYLQASSTS